MKQKSKTNQAGQKSDEIAMPNMIRIENLHHDTEAAFFGARGGVSAGIYNSLNCGYGSGDRADNVQANRKAVAEALSLYPSNLLTVRQVHSSHCVYVEGPWVRGEEPKADALVTGVPELGLGILTADCAPVLLSARDKDGKPLIGAVHAGWRGAFSGIIKNTVRLMTKKGALLDHLQAFVGPCIQRQSYEVGSDFRAKFISRDKSNGTFFTSADADGKFLFDLSGYVVSRLQKAGVIDIASLDIDTFSEEGLYFSYRRNHQSDIDDYGRQLSVIAIRKTS